MLLHLQERTGLAVFCKPRGAIQFESDLALSGPKKAASRILEHGELESAEIKVPALHGDTAMELAVLLGDDAERLAVVAAVVGILVPCTSHRH